MYMRTWILSIRAVSPRIALNKNMKKNGEFSRNNGEKDFTGKSIHAYWNYVIALKRLQSLNLMVEARVSKRLFFEVAKWNKYSQLNEM